MKDALTITFIMFAGIFLSAAPYLPANPTTQAMLAAVAKKRGAGGGDTGDLLDDNFEANEYDDADWAETGTIDGNYQGLVLQGTESLRVVGVPSNYVNTINDHVNDSEVFGYFKIQFQKIEAGIFSGLLNAGVTAYRFSIATTAGGALTITSGTATATTVGTVNTGTTYHIFFRYKAGTGANGEGELGFSTDGTRPTSGDNYVSFTNSNQTTNAEKFGLVGSAGAAFDTEFVADRVVLKTTQISDNP